MVDFLVIGPVADIVLKNILPSILGGGMVIGRRVNKFEGGDCNGIWYSSLEVELRPFLELKEYREGDYDRFDDYDFINIDRTEDIPDYDGVMAVPISFLEKWNRNQFEVVAVMIGSTDFSGLGIMNYHMQSVEGQKTYSRILIRKK